MKLHKSSVSKFIDFFLNGDARELAVNKVEWNVHYPYCDEMEESVVGPEQLDLPECENIEEFIMEINKSKFINVSLVNGKFKVEDTSGFLRAEPAGIYSAGNAEKKMVLVKDGNEEFRLRDFVEYDFTGGSKVLFFRGGSTVSFLGDISLSDKVISFTQQYYFAIIG